MYGPTETTVWSVLRRSASRNGPITIGQPIANTQLHVLDRYDQPAPFGVSGELHIGGDGVAKGLFPAGQADRREVHRRTRSSSVPGCTAPATSPGACRRRDPGSRACDTQIKLRGFRIELEEIEAVLSRRVGPAAVALREDTPGTPMLVGYLAGRLRYRQSDEAVRAGLAEDLPDYMIPSVWVRLELPAAHAEREARPRRTARAGDRRAQGAGVRSAADAARDVAGRDLGGGSQAGPGQPRQRPLLPRRRLDPSVPDRRARQSAGDSSQRAAVARSSDGRGAGGGLGERRKARPRPPGREPISCAVCFRSVRRDGLRLENTPNDPRSDDPMAWRRTITRCPARAIAASSARRRSISRLRWRSSASWCSTSSSPAIPR